MKISKMCGVERGEPFGIPGYASKFNIFVDIGGFEYVGQSVDGEQWTRADNNVLLNIIAAAPDNIIHFPPELTEEERSELNTFFAIGGRWITKGDGGWVQVFNEVKPMRSALGNWVSLQSSCSIFIAPGISKNLRVAKRISDCAQEPFDIAKALGK